MGNVARFFGGLTLALIHADGLTIGKDLAGAGVALLGDSSNQLGVVLTVTSGDPSRVLLALQPDDVGAARVTIAVGSGNQLGSRSFGVYCLADSGTVPVTLSAPGYPDRVIPVRCVPSALVVDQTDIVTRDGGGSIVIVTAAIDTDTGRTIQRQVPRGGIAPVRAHLDNTPPDFLTLRPPPLTF